MIILYFIPSGVYLIAFLIGFMVLDSIAESMSGIAIILIIITMLFPIGASSGAIYSSCEDGISKHKGIAITIMTVTSVISTVYLFYILKLTDVSVDDGLNGIFQSASYISDMAFCLIKVIIACSIYGKFTIDEGKPPIRIAIYHIGITALCMFFVRSMFQSI